MRNNSKSRHSTVGSMHRCVCLGSRPSRDAQVEDGGARLVADVQQVTKAGRHQQRHALTCT